MPKITPHLWYDKEAKQAAELYTSAFKEVFGDANGESAIKNITTLSETPSGDAHIVNIDLCGQEFTLISAGPYFKFTPAISFLVACTTKEQVDALWKKLSKNGKTMMELGTYPFSEKYGWTQDQYGLSWQIMFMGDRPVTQIITPTLMFVGDNCGKAKEAIDFYMSIFHNTSLDHIMHYGPDQQGEKESNIAHASFTLEGEKFAAMDSSGKHEFTFNEAISFIVHCDNQEEVDTFWSKLSAVPPAERCGWLKDQYGVSWQIIPKIMGDMMKNGTKEQIGRVTQAFLKMKKFDIAKLEEAYRN